MHLAVAAIVNALWDLWARLERKPVWKLLVDMEPEVSVMSETNTKINSIPHNLQIARHLFIIS